MQDRSHLPHVGPAHAEIGEQHDHWQRGRRHAAVTTISAYESLHRVGDAVTGQAGKGRDIIDQILQDKDNLIGRGFIGLAKLKVWLHNSMARSMDCIRCEATCRTVGSPTFLDGPKPIGPWRWLATPTPTAR
jgi:hypothetical protein